MIEENEEGFEIRRYLAISILCVILLDLLAPLFATLDSLDLLESLEWGLFIPGMIAVIGSFLLYLYKQSQKKKRLKAMLQTELEHMSAIDNIPETIEDLEEVPPNEDLPPSRIPATTAIQTDAYDGNTDKLGLLDEDYMADIVGFYTGIKAQKKIIRSIHSEVNTPMKDQEKLCNDIGELVDQRKELISE